MSNLVSKFWWAGGLLAAGGVIGLKKYRATPAGRFRVDAALLHLLQARKYFG